jgi:ankyrin repeat protein
MYDTVSYCGSARTADLSSVYENDSNRTIPRAGVQEVPEGGSKKGSRKKQNAYAAAFDSFAPPARADNSSPSASRQHEAAEVSLDPTRVFSSARHARHKDVEASLAAGFDPYYVDSFGNTLFHVACQNGNKRIAKLAIKYGGDMDAQNLRGNTGVHFLFSYGYADIAEYFIEKGASDKLLNDQGNPPRAGIK